MTLIIKPAQEKDSLWNGKACEVLQIRIIINCLL